MQRIAAKGDRCSAAADERDNFQLIVGCESRSGMFSPWYQLEVALHRHVPKIEPHMVEQLSDRRAGLDFEQLSIDLDLHGNALL